MTRRTSSRYLPGLPTRVLLMTQRIAVITAENLHHMPEGEWVHEPAPGEEPVEPHTHRAFGVYNAAEQVITLDDALGFERARDTFLHENLHAMLAIAQLDRLIDANDSGLTEHVVSVLAPVMLAWMRDNPEVVEYLMEVQT